MLAAHRLSAARLLGSGKAVCHYFKNCYITGMGETAPKNVLITGAGKRIGRALALSLAEAGWSLYRPGQSLHDLIFRTRVVLDAGRRAYLSQNRE